MLKTDFIVNLDGFEGPLDLLLSLAKTQKVDLRKISILELAGQYLSFIEKLRNGFDFFIQRQFSHKCLYSCMTFFLLRSVCPWHFQISLFGELFYII